MQTLFDPDVSKWSSWYIIRHEGGISPEHIKAVLWIETHNFSKSKSRLMPYYAGIIEKINSVQIEKKLF